MPCCYRESLRWAFKVVSRNAVLNLLLYNQYNAWHEKGGHRVRTGNRRKQKSRKASAAADLRCLSRGDHPAQPAQRTADPVDAFPGL